MTLKSMIYKQPPAKLLFVFMLISLSLVLIFEPVGAQAPQPKTGWQSFSEPGFGFSLHYPDGWQVRLAADNTERVAKYGEDMALRSIGFFGPGSQMVFVDVWVNRNNRSLSEWMKAYPVATAIDGSLSTEIVATNVAGQLAAQTTAVPPDGSGRAPSHFHTQLVHNDLIFNIEYAALEPDLELYQELLASFSLIDETLQRSTASTLSDALPPAEFGVQVAGCCNVTDFEYNPFPCNTSGDNQCPFPPCGNCTWWVRYRRTGSNEANLIRCTGDAITWQGCINQYYPHLLESVPAKDAITIYPGVNHLAFVESTSGGRFQGSQMAWDEACPARYFTHNNAGKIFVHHPNNVVPNIGPNQPELESPADESWLTSRAVTLEWEDGGDPDEAPQAERDFFATISINNGGWSKHSGWQSKAEWKVDLPSDGVYQWRVKAHDGILESGWTSLREFGVDTAAPIVGSNGQPAPNRWYNTDQSIAWGASDPSPGSGIASVNWDWDDPSPDNGKNGAQGSVLLSSAGQGVHNLYLQAKDHVGHASSVTRLGWFGYDTVAPSIALDANNPATGQWINQPVSIAWSTGDPAPGSGLAYTYRVWDQAELLPWRIYANETRDSSTLLTASQGKHSLYLQVWDQAGNASQRAEWGWIGYDSLAPAAPTIDPGCEAANSAWQNSCFDPNFTWQSVDPLGDKGSGVAAYGYTWGNATETTTANWAAATGFDAGPAAADGWSKQYLHVQAKDGAANLSPPATFGLWYDGTLPELSFTINDGATTIDQAEVQLDLLAEDTGSGVRLFRIASNDQAWSDWQPYAPSLPWTLNVVNSPDHTVYVQVQDQAGNLSEVASQTVTGELDGEPIEAAVAAVETETSVEVDAAPLQELGQAGDFAVVLQGGAYFTNVATQTVQVSAPVTGQIRLSDDPNFVDQGWAALQADHTWVLAEGSASTEPVTLYAWIKDQAGQIYGPYFANIIYDSGWPKGWLRVASADASTVNLRLAAWDDNSGIAEMRFGSDPAAMMADPTSGWQPYAITAALPPTGGVIYAQFRDLAGNLSPIYGTDGSDSSLTERLYMPLLGN